MDNTEYYFVTYLDPYSRLPRAYGSSVDLGVADAVASEQLDAYIREHPSLRRDQFEREVVEYDVGGKIGYRTQRLEKLQRLTADRPAHAAFLRNVVALYQQGKQDHEWPDVPAGVSPGIQEAIESDVAAAYDNSSGHDFGAYEGKRVAHRRGARRRQETMDSLEHLLQIGGE